MATISFADSKIDKIDFEISPLNSTNFRVWLIRMKIYLQSHGVESVIERECQDFQLDVKVRHVIMSHLTDMAVLKVYKATSAKKMWDLILAQYAESTKFLPANDSDVTVPQRK